MCENCWFYTLSAIPQTLAAMIALAAAFAVFKLNFISEKISNIRVDLRRFILLLTSPEQKEIHDIEPLNEEGFLGLFQDTLNKLNPDDELLGLPKEMYEKFSKEMERIIFGEWNSFYKGRPGRVFGYLEMRKNSFEKLIKIKKMCLELLVWSLILIVLIISTALYFLPNFNYFQGSNPILYLIVLASILGIGFTAYSVIKIAKA